MAKLVSSLLISRAQHDDVKVELLIYLYEAKSQMRIDLSWLTERTLLDSSDEKTIEFTMSVWPCSLKSISIFGLSLTKLICELQSPAASKEFPVLYAKQEMGPLETRRVLQSFWLRFVFHILTMPSLPPEAIFLPYGPNAMHWPPFSWALTLAETRVGGTQFSIIIGASKFPPEPPSASLCRIPAIDAPENPSLDSSP